MSRAQDFLTGSTNVTSKKRIDILMEISKMIKITTGPENACEMIFEFDDASEVKFQVTRSGNSFTWGAN